MNDLDDDLREAARVGDLPAICRLLDKGADIDAFTGDDDGPVLVVAAADGQLAAVCLLLDRGADVDGRDEYGGTALHAAAETNQLDLMCLLLLHGARVDAQSEAATPLITASRAGNIACVRLLLAYGADTHIRDHLDEMIAWEWAREEDHTEVMTLLEEAGSPTPGERPLTRERFAEALWNMVQQHLGPERSLEEYLRSLWSLTQAHENEPPSFRLFVRLLSEAFSAPAPRFEEGWRAYIEPPGNDDDAKPPHDFGFLERTLLFQIADLHRRHILASAVPTAHAWYDDTSPKIYLDCAISGLHWYMDANGCDVTECDWRELARVLELGRGRLSEGESGRQAEL